MRDAQLVLTWGERYPSDFPKPLPPSPSHRPFAELRADARAEAVGAPAPFVEPERRFGSAPSSLTTAIGLNRCIIGCWGSEGFSIVASNRR
jgi:hypothetical protein